MLVPLPALRLPRPLRPRCKLKKIPPHGGIFLFEIFQLLFSNMSERFKPPEKSKLLEDLALDEYSSELEKQHGLQNKIDALNEALDIITKKPKYDPAILQLETDYERTMIEWRKQLQKTKEAGRKVDKILQKAADKDYAQNKLNEEQWEELKKILETDENK